MQWNVSFPASKPDVEGTRRYDLLTIAMHRDVTWCQLLKTGSARSHGPFWDVLVGPDPHSGLSHLSFWAPVHFGHTHMLQGVFRFEPWIKEILAIILGDLFATSLFNLHLNKRPVSVFDTMQSYFSLPLDSPGYLRPFNMLTWVINQQEWAKGIDTSPQNSAVL